MARKKLKLAFIVNNAKRKAAYEKMKKGLLKQVSELSTLCDIDACAIIYSPYDPKPEGWPSTLRVQRVIAQFKRMPQTHQTKNMLNVESFLRQRIAKLNEQIKKQLINNHDKEMTLLMYECLLTGKEGLRNLTLSDLNDLGSKIHQKIKDVNECLEANKNIAPRLQVASAYPPEAPSPGSDDWINDLI